MNFYILGRTEAAQFQGKNSEERLRNSSHNIQFSVLLELSNQRITYSIYTRRGKQILGNDKDRKYILYIVTIKLT